MSTVTIRGLDTADGNMIASSCACYQAGYAGPPWNETWDLETIRTDILGALSLPHAICLVALADGEVVGLTLAYGIMPDQLAEHVGLPAAANGCQPGMMVAYQDEIVVRPDYQGKGVGRLLYDALMERIGRAGLKRVVARTLSDPPTVVYPWFQRMGYVISARYDAPDMRVMLALDLH